MDRPQIISFDASSLVSPFSNEDIFVSPGNQIMELDDFDDLLQQLNSPDLNFDNPEINQILNNVNLNSNIGLSDDLSPDLSPSKVLPDQETINPFDMLNEYPKAAEVKQVIQIEQPQTIVQAMFPQQVQCQNLITNQAALNQNSLTTPNINLQNHKVQLVRPTVQHSSPQMVQQSQPIQTQQTQSQPTLTVTDLLSIIKEQQQQKQQIMAQQKVQQILLQQLVKTNASSNQPAQVQIAKPIIQNPTGYNANQPQLKAVSTNLTTTITPVTFSVSPGQIFTTAPLILQPDVTVNKMPLKTITSYTSTPTHNSSNIPVKRESISPSSSIDTPKHLKNPPPEKRYLIQFIN